MNIFNFFKRKTDQKIFEGEPDRSSWTGKDFEFLIRGDLEIDDNEFDKIMTPTSFDWIKYEKDDWPYYKIGLDEFTYSFEIVGIQMTFNSEIRFEKAKKIADEVVENIRKTGQNPELLILDSTLIYRFD